MRTHRRTLLATGLVALLTIAGVTAAIANDPPPRIAFLANGIVPADALAAGPIAGQLGAPIFTTAPDTLPTSTADAMSDYAPQLVIVMGGPVAISDAVVGQVSAATGLSVANPSPPPSSGIVRAAGQDRFETAAAAAALLAAYDPAYLPTDMQAIDSDKLDGKDSTAFLGKTQKAADSDLLDGKDSTAFLGKTQKAADADELDGIDSTGFAPVYRIGNEPLAVQNVASGTVLCETSPFVAPRDMVALLTASASAIADTSANDIWLRLTKSVDGGAHANVSDRVSAQQDTDTTFEGATSHADVATVTAGESVVFGVRINGGTHDNVRCNLVVQLLPAGPDSASSLSASLSAVSSKSSATANGD